MRVPNPFVIEFGLKDYDARDWSGQARLIGAKVVHREGYRFRAGDKLVGAESWEASAPIKGGLSVRVPIRQQLQKKIKSPSLFW